MRHGSVAKRLTVGLGTLAGGVLLLAATAVGATLFLNSEFALYRGAAQGSNAANAIAEDMFEARLAVAAFEEVEGDSPELRAELRDNLGEVRQVAAGQLAAPGLAEAHRARLRTIAEGAEAFESGFARAADLKVARDRTLETMAATGLSAREALTALMDASNRAGEPGPTFSAARVQQALMRGRTYLERFVRSGEAAELETAREALGYAGQQLSWMATMLSDGTRAELLAQARGLVADYAEGAESLAETRAARDAARAAMRAGEDAANAAVEALVEDLVALQGETGRRIETVFTGAEWGVAVVAAVALLAALALSRALLRGIRRDFDAALATVGELADGNLDVEITGADRDTEFGRLARALEVFRDRGREAQELARREAEAREERRQSERRSDEQRRKADREREEAEKRAAEARKREIFEALRAAVDGVVSAAAAGDFSRRVDAAALDPELQPMGEGLDRLMDNVERGLGEIARVSSRLAEGDLREGMSGRYEGTFEALQRNVESMIASLGGLLSTVAAEAEGVAGQSAEMTKGAEDLARRAESQAASLEQTSAAVTEIASSAEANARSAAETDAAAGEMTAEAGQARGVLDGTVAAMRDIEAHAKEIEAIVDVIEDIAFQTNLLSLNASVEAARAGEAGKGFAVVANEVRALAQRSAEASAKVQQIITQSTGAISRGASAVDETGEALGRIVARIETVSSNLREIKAASDEQATAVKDVSNAFGQLDKITQKNAAVAEQTRGSAAQLAAQSDRMREAIGRVRLRAAANAAADAAGGAARPGDAAGMSADARRDTAA